jgi:predicted ribonuclease YlaK
MKQPKRQIRSNKERVQKDFDPRATESKVSKFNDYMGYKQFQLTDSQQEFANKIIANDMVVCSSPAGTGKSLTALYTFVQMYLRDPSLNITVVRTPVEVGADKVGFLPNSLSEKIEPHFASSKLLLTKLLNKGKVETDLEHRLHFKIPNYLLGSTLDNTLLLVDECQELPPLIMKLILERIGINSKVVILGDPTQRYSNEAGRNGLSDVLQRFFYKDADGNFVSKFKDIDHHAFTIDEVQRSDFVKTVLTAYMN